MAKISADIKVDTTKLDRLSENMKNLVGAATGEASAAVVRAAKDYSRVLTGDMRSGWNRSRIGRGNQGGWRIYNTVPYTVYHEFGTWKMSAQPMLGPAMDEEAYEFPSRVLRLIEISTISYIDDSGGEIEF